MTALTRRIDHDPDGLTASKIQNIQKEMKRAGHVLVRLRLSQQLASIQTDFEKKGSVQKAKDALDSFVEKCNAFGPVGIDHAVFAIECLEFLATLEEDHKWIFKNCT